MKDLYTFHTSEEDLDQWYLKVRQAYRNIFDRLGLHYKIVNADSGISAAKTVKNLWLL